MESNRYGLKEHAPEVHGRFQPAVANFNATSDAGMDLPKELVELYEIVNGTDPNSESAGIFPSNDRFERMAYGPFALEQIVSEWEMQNELLEGGEFGEADSEDSADEVLNEWWNPGWIPFAGNGGGDYLCIDTVPAKGGKKGQVITHSHETGTHLLLAPSLVAYLHDLANALEAGHYENNEDYGLCAKEPAHS